MKPHFYTLMYVDKDENRRLALKTYKNEERIDLFVKGCCVLDKSLKINGFWGGDGLNK